MSAPDEAGPRYTIDELAAASGVPSRTIRYYQSKGTLPAPVREGRVAFYDEAHLERLRLIAELQDKGLRLDAIRDALEQLERGGDSLQRWLGVGERLQAPWSDDRPIVLSEAELTDLMGDGMPPGTIATLERHGLIERQGHARPASFVVPSPGLLALGQTLVTSGIDLDTAVEASRLMRRRIGRMADELVEYFDERAGHGFGGDGSPAEVAEAFDALRPVGLDAVQLIFAQEIERSLRAYVEGGRAVRAATRSKRRR